mgnify:CR=1 FL=1
MPSFDAVSEVDFQEIDNGFIPMKEFFLAHGGLFFCKGNLIQRQNMSL